ncbi:hypothetical protein CCP4SC76_1240009 [Gammaproteobacteria bacterium]
MSSFVLCVRGKVSEQDSFNTCIGSVSYLEVPNNIDTPLPSHNLGGVKKWFEKILALANPDGGRSERNLDIVFFVHGYNTDAKESLGSVNK